MFDSFNAVPEPSMKPLVNETFSTAEPTTPLPVVLLILLRFIVTPRAFMIDTAFLAPAATSMPDISTSVTRPDGDAIFTAVPPGFPSSGRVPAARSTAGFGL